MINYTITFFPKLTEPSSVFHTNIDPILNAIKSGGDFIETVMACRVPGLSRSKQNKIKETLPGIGFSGTFSKRSNDALIESSGLMMLDFDKTLEIPKNLQPFVFVKFISPTGTGLKILIKIPLVKNDAQYKTYFIALQKEFPSLDPSGKDISRLTYISYDPDIKINENSQVWDKKIEGAPPAPSKEPLKGPQIGGIHKIQSNYSKILIALKLVQQSQVGNRHDSILKAGKLMGGYIAGGEVKEEDVLKIFEAEVYNQMDNPEIDFKKQWQTFLDGIKYGKALPLKDRERERKSIKAEFRAEDVYGDVYYTAADVDAELNEMYEHGNLRGVSTGWPTFDEYYSVAPGYFSLFYGAPFTGKSVMLFELLINLSKLHGWRHLVFSPETGGPKDVYAQLIQIYAQADITNTFNSRMSKEAFDAAKKFVNDHFLVIDSEIEGADFTLEDFLVYVQILERKFNVKFNTITGDPLIEFKFDDDIRDDVFWNRQLKIVRVQAKLNNWHIFLLTHIIKQGRAGIDDLGNVVYPIPGPGEIAGGQTFWRKGFQIVCFYRHVFEGAEYEMLTLKQVGNLEVHPNSLWLIVMKSKPGGMGKTGRIHFRYNVAKHHFTDPSGQVTVNQSELFPAKFNPRLPYSEKDDLPDFQPPKGFMKIEGKEEKPPF